MSKDNDDGFIMSKELKRQVERMTTFQRTYAEYRGRGLNQADSALKAGSQAKGRQALGRVGYNVEATVPGVKAYMAYLQTMKARAACVSELEIIEMLRNSYREAMNSGKYNDANKSAELLGNYIGMFAKSKAGTETKATEGPVKNNVGAFKDDGETEEERNRRLGSILSLMKE